MNLAGRRLNDNMGGNIAQAVVKALNRSGRAASDTRIGVLGLTFKANVSGIRNSKVPDIIAGRQRPLRLESSDS